MGGRLMKYGGCLLMVLLLSAVGFLSGEAARAASREPEEIWRETRYNTTNLISNCAKNFYCISKFTERGIRWQRSEQ